MDKTINRLVMSILVLAVFAAIGCTKVETVEVPVEKVVERVVEKEVPVEKVVVQEKVVEVEKQVPVEVVKPVIRYVETARQDPPPSPYSVLRVGNSGEVQFLDAAKSQSGTDIIFSEMIYSRLLQYDATMMDSKPDIAESWTISGDSKEYVFKIRDDVKFHNGKALTAYDVE